LQGKVEGTHTTWYSYDALGNLVQVRMPRQKDGGQANGDVVEYIIDGQNRRIARKVNGRAVNTWIYSGQLTLAAELDSMGQIVSRFVGDYMIKNGETYRVITDHIGSIRLVVNSQTGLVVERLDYDEFGRVLNDQSPGFVPFGFAHGLFDQETKLLRFGARDYDPSTGVWTAKDPIGIYGGTSNLYEYSVGDPINIADPFGLQTTVYIWKYRGSTVAWGHASLSLSNGTYISWWPSPAGRDPKISSSLSDIYTADPIIGRKFENDVRDEQQNPDQIIYINGLDEAAIEKWWNDFRKNNKWKTLSTNCSFVAAQGLKVGGGGQPWWVSADNLVWTPTDVAGFARDVQRQKSGLPYDRWPGAPRVK